MSVGWVGSPKCGICTHPDHTSQRCGEPIVVNVGDEIYRRMEVVAHCSCDPGKGES